MNKLIAHALVENSNGEVLILKRTMIKRGKPNFEGGRWDIPGGTVEEGETPSQAAVREVKEEVNLDVESDGIIFEKSNYDVNKGIMFTTLIYKCHVIGDMDIKLQLEEHDEYRWIRNEEIINMNSDVLVSYMKELFNMLING